MGSGSHVTALHLWFGQFGEKEKQRSQSLIRQQSTLPVLVCESVITSPSNRLLRTTVPNLTVTLPFLFICSVL